MTKWILGPLIVMLSLPIADAWSTCVTYSWIATGDDGHIGQAAQYDVRYSASYITENNWKWATRVDRLPTPGEDGTYDSVVIADLEPNVRYYFAIKAADEQNNWSELSNVRSFVAPADICEDRTGNVDCSDNGICNLADITRLIDHVYISRMPLCCPLQANVDGDPFGIINLSDITRLIDYVYITGQATAECN